MNDDEPPSRKRNGLLARLLPSWLGEPDDRKQILNLLHSAERRNVLGREALSMIEGVFQVSEMQVGEIMIPRAQMAVVNEDNGIESMLQTAIESGHSRFPVFDDEYETVRCAPAMHVHP